MAAPARSPRQLFRLPTQGEASTIRRALDELIVESLRVLLPVTVFVVWIWVTYVILLANQNTLLAFAVLGLSGVSAFISYQLHRHHLRFAVAVYLSGLACIVTLSVIAQPKLVIKSFFTSEHSFFIVSAEFSA